MIRDILVVVFWILVLMFLLALAGGLFDGPLGWAPASAPIVW